MNKKLNYGEVMTKKINGTMINYYFICKTKLWLFSHNIQLEDESYNVIMGRNIHDESYKRENEQLIDNLIAVDFIRKQGDTYEIHEVKKSNKMELAHKYQLLYYMYYLKNNKGFKKIKGILNYPTIRQTETLELTQENIDKLKDIIVTINTIINNEIPKPIKNKKCYKCAYYEFCFI